MRRPTLLDLYGCQGGTARGYHAAGFDVTGVDTFQGFSQARYPYASVKADALDYLASEGHRFDAIHASPPCQHASTATRAMRAHGDDRYADLVAPTRDLLQAHHQAHGTPWVMENVVGAALVDPVLLCWSMFYPAADVADQDGVPLRMERHRLWEASPGLDLVAPGPCRHERTVQVGGAYGGGQRTIAGARARALKPGAPPGSAPGGYVPSRATQEELMGLEGADMTQWGIHQAIPPVYALWVGLQLRAHVRGKYAHA